jgi:sarcosine oxidase subunit beta
MKATADVVIIGGGVVGASIAYHLAEAGCRDVLILEREGGTGLGSTGRATGGVRAQFATSINIRMSLYSIEFLSRFREATGHDAGYDPAGYLFLATGERQLEYLRLNRERQVSEGLTNVEMMSAQAIAHLVPQLRTTDVVGGTFCPTDGFIKPLNILRGFTERALERGVRLWLETQVNGIEIENNRVMGVMTTRGAVSTRAVVNAAGAWAAQVARLAGIEIPVVPLRRQLVGLKPTATMPERFPMVVDLSDGFHLRPDGLAQQGPGVLLAWPDPEERPGFETEFAPEFAAKILPRAINRVPCLAEAEVDAERCRAGLYEVTPDHHAIIGETPGLGGFYQANGFSGHGVMHSPATGRVVSELILDGQARTIDVSALGLERFAHGRLLAESTAI